MESEGVCKLKGIARALNDSIVYRTNVSPSTAEISAREYEIRSELWRRLIAAQSAALLFVQTVANEGEHLTEEVMQAIEDEAERIDSVNIDIQPSEHVTSEPDIAQYIEDTRKLLEECPEVWEKISVSREKLWDEVNKLMNAQVKEAETANDSDWTAICEVMKTQRESLQIDIEESNARFAKLDQEMARPALQNVHDCMTLLRELKCKRRESIASAKTMEKILEEFHGIMVPDDDFDMESDVQDFLVEEEETMIGYYEAKLKRYSRIFNVSSTRQATSENIEVTVVPKSDWLVYWSRKKPDHPNLKFLKVTYARNQIYPLEITVKINTSLIPPNIFDAVVNPIVGRIQQWKKDMLVSAHLDLHSLVRIFM